MEMCPQQSTIASFYFQTCQPSSSSVSQMWPSRNNYTSPSRLLIPKGFVAHFLLLPSYPNFFDTSIHQWCKTNIHTNITVNNIPWYILFPFILWSFWLSCNSLVFSNKYITLSQLCKTRIHHATEFFYLSMHPKLQHPTTITAFDGWKPTPFPFLTLNTDGSIKGNMGHAGVGGIIRDHWGKWIGGFSFNIGITYSIMAELWAIREGLKFAWNNGYKYINLQVDSKLAHNWITNLNSLFPLEYSNLIHDCRSLLEQPWVVKTDHIWRKANGCTDLLAKRGADQSEREIFYDTCPTSLTQCYFWDSLGLTSPRSVGCI